jgi:hypothetical protein
LLPIPSFFGVEKNIAHPSPIFQTAKGCFFRFFSHLVGEKGPRIAATVFEMILFLFMAWKLSH